MENDLISRSALIKDVEAREIVVHSNEHPFDAMRKQGKAFRECVENAPAVDAVEAIKSTEEIEQALSILNIYRNSYYAEPSGTVKYAVANAINTILPLFTKCLERRTDA